MPTFIEKIELRFGVVKRDKIVKAVTQLLEEAYDQKYKTEPPKVYDDRIMININDPDKVQSFGILQGLYLVLGYSSQGSSTDPDSPAAWYEGIEYAIARKAYQEYQKSLATT